jgi:hypothetical protein
MEIQLPAGFRSFSPTATTGSFFLVWKSGADIERQSRRAGTVWKHGRRTGSLTKNRLRG